MKTRIFLMAVLVLIAAIPAAQTKAGDFRAGDITISNPWARASFGKAKSAAAYMTVKNGGANADRLIAVKSAIAKKAQIHHTQTKDGVMKMGSMKGLDLPGGGMAMLKPGGRHVMFMGLVEPLREGTSFPLTLVFAKAGEVLVMVRVLKPGASGGADTRHQKH